MTDRWERAEAIERSAQAAEERERDVEELLSALVSLVNCDHTHCGCKASREACDLVRRITGEFPLAYAKRIKARP